MPFVYNSRLRWTTLPLIKTRSDPGGKVSLNPVHCEACPNVRGLYSRQKFLSGPWSSLPFLTLYLPARKNQRSAVCAPDNRPGRESTEDTSTWLKPAVLSMTVSAEGLEIRFFLLG